MKETKNISLRIDKSLLEKIDSNATQRNLSRSKFIIDCCNKCKIIIVEGGLDIAKELHKISLQLEKLKRNDENVSIELLEERLGAIWESLNFAIVEAVEKTA